MNGIQISRRISWIAVLVCVLILAGCGSYERSYAAGRVAGRILLLLLVAWAIWRLLARLRKRG